MNRKLIGMLVACLLAWARADEPVWLKGAQANLRFDKQGVSLVPLSGICPPAQAAGQSCWSLELEPDTWPATAGKALVLTDQTQSVLRETLPDGFRLSYDTLTDGSRTFRIGLTLDFRAKAGGFEVTGTVTNGAKGWLLTGFTGPVLGGIEADLAKQPALLPEGFGKRVNRVPQDGQKPAPWSQLGNGFEIAQHYPGARGTMQWLVLAGEAGGLYFGSHDPLHRAKSLSLRYDPAARRFGMAVRHGFFCRSGESVELPPLMIRPYAGTWHAAARIYRAWFDATLKLREVPGWVRSTSGWLLCILKQQNGEIMWDYSSLSKLCDVAEARGLDILGLFGWAHGGHDHLYPDYIPCPEMGGRDALKAALAEVRRRGKRSIIYANGQLQEREATKFWQETGKDIAIMRRDGVTYRQTYHKYSNIPIYLFDLGCLYAEAWYERMLSLALQANELGADGILYDQLAMMSPMACYGEGHGHPVPALVHEQERPVFLRRIAEHMRQINPEFIVMTEGLHDCALDAVAMFHACQTGAFYASADEMTARQQADRTVDPFPEMFRYTFPEVLSTARVPTPMLDRNMANYSCVYGLRHEIESRYGPDVTYLLDNRVPEVADYEHVKNKPDIAMMRATLPDEAARYLQRLIGFQRAHAGLLWEGRYVDTEGFAFAGEGLMAKGFEAGDRVGVMVWNFRGQALTFTASVPGAALLFAEEPEQGRVEPFGALAPQTVRLLVWKR